jgi:hypothetical protein
VQPGVVGFEVRLMEAGGVADAIRRNSGVLTFEQVEIESLAAQGDLVVMVIRQRGHWRHNGEEFDERGLLEFRVRAARVLGYRGVVLPFAP